MANVSQWKLRRLAPRALNVLERHKGSATWIAVFEATMGVSAQAVIDRYDEVHALSTVNRAMTTAKHGGASKLLRELRGWTNAVKHHIPSIDRGEFGDKPGVPDDVISDVLLLIATVDKHEEQTGNALPFAEALRTELTEHLEAAKKEWGVSVGTDANVSAKRIALREACAAFNRDLISFRTALETLLGSSSPDYQKLRLSRVRIADTDDDELGAALPDALEGDSADEPGVLNEAEDEGEGQGEGDGEEDAA